MKKGLLASILVATAASVMLLSGVLAREPQAAPESEGFSSERLARISMVMRAEIDNGTLPGAVTLIARNRKIVHFAAHRYLNAGKTKPMTQDAVFRVFSMTKRFVSVVAMMLVERGRMQLSDPISTWIPEFKDMKVLIEKKDTAWNVTREHVPAERPITVQDLLRHTSGFAYADNAPFPEIDDFRCQGLFCEQERRWPLFMVIPRPSEERAPVIATVDHADLRGLGPTFLVSVGRLPGSGPAGFLPPLHAVEDCAKPRRPLLREAARVS
jgi:CubicO group peptidase (beta-lactamase class C family)